MSEQTERLSRKYIEEDTSVEAQDVIDIFISVFGEEHIDVQKSLSSITESMIAPDEITGNDDFILNRICSRNGYRNIIIKIDHETVSNELGLSTEIFDFFVKVMVDREGKLHGYPEYKKATFTEDQLFSGYIHSHTPSLQMTEAGIQNWGHVCLGTGPISGTIRQLWTSPTQGLWLGFIGELRQIVRHESLEGGPYFRLEHIKGPSKEIKSCEMVRSTNLKPWIALMKSYIRAGRMKFGFVSNEFCIGTTFVEWLIDFTEYAKEWAKVNNLESTRTYLPLKDTHIQNNRIYDVSSANQTRVDAINAILGKPVIVFKGTTYLLKQIKNAQTNVRKLFDYRVAATLLRKTLNVLNYWYHDNGISEPTNTPVYK